MKRVALILVALTALFGSPALAADPVTGRWVTPEKDAVITISQCGATYCGRITQYLVRPDGGPGQKDVNNPNPDLRSRTLLNQTRILSNFKLDNGTWRGTIYDPRNGKSYRSILRRKSANVLEVKGCLGPFCQTQTWTKAR